MPLWEALWPATLLFKPLFLCTFAAVISIVHNFFSLTNNHHPFVESVTKIDKSRSKHIVILVLPIGFGNTSNAYETLNLESIMHIRCRSSSSFIWLIAKYVRVNFKLCTTGNEARTLKYLSVVINSPAIECWRSKCLFDEIGSIDRRLFLIWPFLCHLTTWIEPKDLSVWIMLMAAIARIGSSFYKNATVIRKQGAERVFPGLINYSN